MLILKIRFSCLPILLDATFRDVCPIVRVTIPNPTSGETPIKFTHACFPPIYSYTITSASLSINLLSNESVRKFTYVSFFSDIQWIVGSTKHQQEFMYFIPTSISSGANPQHFKLDNLIFHKCWVLNC